MIPQVSVCLTTYNHEPYVAQAVESVLAQRTSFAYELIIGEDDSSDRTREIVKGYADDPHVRLLLNDRSHVIYVKGRPTGRWNFVNTLRHARGRYVALLEGDDYWKDPHKLQKQVTFLDAHPDCEISFHAVEYLYRSDRREVRRPAFPPSAHHYTLGDLLRENFIPTCSVVFRNRPNRTFPDWYFCLPMGDWPLHLLNARHGAIGYLDEVMAVYRKHETGAWSLQGALYQLESDIAVLEAVREELGPQYTEIAHESAAYFHLKFLYILAREHQFAKLFERAAELLLNRPVPLKTLIRVALLARGRSKASAEPPLATHTYPREQA